MDEKLQAARDALLDKIAQLARSTNDAGNVEHLANAYAAVAPLDPKPKPATPRVF